MDLSNKGQMETEHRKMNRYTYKDAEKLFEICPKIYRSQERDVKPIYGLGGVALGFVKGPVTYEDEGFVIAKLKGVVDLSYNRDEIFKLLGSTDFFDEAIAGHEKALDGTDEFNFVYTLKCLREFIYKVGRRDVPLWITELPILVKWRLEIGK